MTVPELAKKYGLKVKEIDKGVFQVLTKKQVNVDKILLELVGCALSLRGEMISRKGKDFAWYRYSELLYIFYGMDSDKVVWKYEDEIRKQYKDSYTLYSEIEDSDCIGAIYSRID